jgi:hypothetical protein
VEEVKGFHIHTRFTVKNSDVGQLIGYPALAIRFLFPVGPVFHEAVFAETTVIQVLKNKSRRRTVIWNLHYSIALLIHASPAVLFSATTVSASLELN